LLQDVLQRNNLSILDKKICRTSCNSTQGEAEVLVGVLQDVLQRRSTLTAEHHHKNDFGYLQKVKSTTRYSPHPARWRILQISDWQKGRTDMGLPFTFNNNRQ
jgi:hypothetical protein